jgi:hypothetical protein
VALDDLARGAGERAPVRVAATVAELAAVPPGA